MKGAHSISRRAFGRAIGAVTIGGNVYFETDTGGNPAQPSRKPLDEITSMSAVELVARLRKKDISARDVMTAHLAHIDRVNPKVNAIVTLVAERAMADAARADETMARSGPIGVLHGLPVAHKDLVDTAGIRTTRGSPFFRDNVPTETRRSSRAFARRAR